MQMLNAIVGIGMLGSCLSMISGGLRRSGNSRWRLCFWGGFLLMAPTFMFFVAVCLPLFGSNMVERNYPHWWEILAIATLGPLGAWLLAKFGTIL